jgi:ubiquinone/menaquinone biosynthesis C-methylase UbiE
MAFTTDQWHQRYLQQAQWTQSIRFYIYSKAKIGKTARLLDIGCGTGVLEKEFETVYQNKPFSLDLSSQVLRFARSYAPAARYTQADGMQLPFDDNNFDISLCHFLLLWITQPLKALKEMVRVTCPGGYVIALAEPDYGGRIDFPPELSKIGSWQVEALKGQGANPQAGRELRSLFHQAGLTEIEAGVLGGQWIDQEGDLGHEMEWEVLKADLSQNDDFNIQAEQLEKLDQMARITGKRILYVPTFYAWGKVRG